MTTAQVMSLYELSKRQQAMLHTQGGIHVDTIDGRHQDVHYLTPDAIEKIKGTLTTEQKSTAGAMQKFMAAQAAKWDNAASNKMFGYDKFTEEHYFPITTDKTTVRTNNNSVNNEMINSIRNMGMTKQVVPGADNPIVIKDIFDVFAGHINDMAT